MVEERIHVNKRTTLARMKSGQTGVIVEFNGGQGITNRLHALGLRPGNRVKKVGSMFAHGPVTIRVGTAEIALGYGAADKVIVELEK